MPAEVRVTAIRRSLERGSLAFDVLTTVSDVALERKDFHPLDGESI